jgi:outer membrane protein TolC
LGSEYSLTQTAEPPWLWSVSTDWLLDVGLRRRMRGELADTQLRAARADYAEALWTTRSELRAALLSYLINEQRRAVAIRAVADQERLLALQRQRVAVGEAARGEASLVELELARARSSLADNSRVQATALLQIAQSLGVSVAVVKQQAFNWDDVLHIIAVDDAQLNDLREAALLSRADLERAMFDYQSRELELRQAVRQQYPQLSIGPGYMWDHGIKKATLGVSFSLSIFNRNQGPIAEAEARRTAAGEQALAIQAQVLNEIDSARDAYQLAMQTLAAVLQQSDAAEALLQQANRELSLGATDQTGVISAKVAADAQSLAVLDAVERMQQSLGQLEDALRTPLSGPEMALGKTTLLEPAIRP